MAHRPRTRMAFRLGFLRARCASRVSICTSPPTAACRCAATATLRRQVLLLHDVFQLTLPGRHPSWLHRRVYGAMDRFLIGHAVRAADAIWTPSQFSAGELAGCIRVRGRTSVLPNAVLPLAVPSTAADPALPARYWLVVGTREPRKNIPFLLQQWRALRGDGSPLPDLVLVGDCGDVDTELAGLPGLHWRGGLSDAQLSRLYHDAERLLHPATAEGFGLPVIGIELRYAGCSRHRQRAG